MKKLIGLFIVLTVIVLAGCNKEKTYSSADEMVADLQSSVSAVSVEELKEKQDAMEEFFLLIDVREAQEYNFGFIPGATNICGGSLIFKMGNAEYWDSQMMYLPEETDEIILYCKKGKRSIIAASMLQQLGYNNVKIIDGGWKKWELTYPLLYEKYLDANAHEEVEEAGGC